MSNERISHVVETTLDETSGTRQRQAEPDVGGYVDTPGKNSKARGRG